MRIWKLLTLTGALVVSGALVRADLVIDDFETDDGTPISMTLNAPGALSDFETGLPTGQTIGGRRDVALTHVSGTAQTQALVNTSSPNSVGRVSYSSATGADGYFTLSYGAAAPLNQNLNLYEYFRFVWDVADYAAQVTVTLTTGAGTHTASFWSPSGLQDLDPDVTVYLPFTAFSGTPDWTDVDTITFLFNPPSEGDSSLKEITTTTLIPEASSIVMGIG